HFISDFGEILLGGMHYVYIVNSNNDDTLFQQMGSYDGCSLVRKLLNSSVNIDKLRVYKNVTWVNFPMMAEGYSMEDGMVPPCDVKVRLRVARPYSLYGTGDPVDSISLNPDSVTYVVANGKIKYANVNYGAGQTFVTDGINTQYSVITPGVNPPTAVVLKSGGNNGYPMYSFNTDNMANEPYNVD